MQDQIRKERKGEGGKKPVFGLWLGKNPGDLSGEEAGGIVIGDGGIWYGMGGNEMLTDLCRRSRRKEEKRNETKRQCYSTVWSWYVSQRGANWACDGEEKKEKERTNRSGWLRYCEACGSSDLEVTH